MGNEKGTRVVQFKRLISFSLAGLAGFAVLVGFQNCGKQFEIADDTGYYDLYPKGSPGPSATPTPSGSATPTPTSTPLYNLQNRWSFIAPGAGLPTSRQSSSMVWALTKFILFGGRSTDGNTPSAGIQNYEPGTNQWTQINSASTPSARSGHSAVWSGQKMFVFGGDAGISNSINIKNELFSYDPATNQWSSIAVPTSVTRRAEHSAVWTGTEMIVFGGYFESDIAPIDYKKDGFRFNPTNNSFVPISTQGAPSERAAHAAVWTGSRMLIFGGRYHGALGNVVLNDLYSYDPGSDSWSKITQSSAPAVRFSASAVWTGDKMIIFGGTTYVGNNAPAPYNNGGVYDPASNTWTSLSAVNPPTERYKAAAAWSGNGMYIFGGLQGPSQPAPSQAQTLVEYY